MRFKFRKANIITGALFAASFAILCGVVYFAFNIQVLANWHLSLPSGDMHAGDSVVVASTYTKLRQVTGTSTRTLECQVKPGIYLSTPLTKVPANRAPGATGTGILVTFPAAIQGIENLPDTCRVCVYLQYPVLPLRTVPYFKCTDTFKLLPKIIAPATASSSSTGTNLVPVATVIQTSPSSNTTVATAQPQSNTLPTPSTTNTDTTTNNPAPQAQTCRVSVLGLKLFCK